MANHGAHRFNPSNSTNGNRDAVMDGKNFSPRPVPPPLLTGGLEFSSLTYTVVKKEEVNGKWLNQEVDLLHRISGYAPKGCVTAVMGPSGAGKSTFLDGLAGRIASGSLKGRVSLDGTEMSTSLIKRTSAYIMQDDRLFPMLTVYETLMFAADLRLGKISKIDKKQRVETLIEQLGLLVRPSTRNTCIGDEGTRGVSGGERRRVSIGVDIIHGPALLFLDEPTSGLDSTSAHSVIDRVHHIARSGSTVILTIHQPSYRIQMLLDHLIILARGQLMYQGSPKDVTLHLARMGRKAPKGENSIEHFLDVIQEYDQSEIGVEPLAEFCLTGMKPPPVSDNEPPVSIVMSPTPLPPLSRREVSDGERRTPKRLTLWASGGGGGGGGGGRGEEGKRLRAFNVYDHSVRTPWASNPWSSSQSGVMATLMFTPSQPRKQRNPPSLSPGYYTYSNEILPGTPTPHSSDYTVDENDYWTPKGLPNSTNHFGPKFSNSPLTEISVLIRRNFITIRRTPELFLSRQMVLTVMGIMMATMFINPSNNDVQGITNRLSFFIFTVCLFFFSSNDAVPAFIQERLIFVRESSHNAYRASSYVVAGLVTYLPFFAVQAATYAGIVWFALGLRGQFLYFLLVLYLSLLSTNSFVVFVSSVVPNYILGYAAVIAFTALFFLFCGYFVNASDIPHVWGWMNTVSTMKYPYEGLLINQYLTNGTFGFDPKGNKITGIDILTQLALKKEESAKWEMVLWLLGWAVFYRVLFYLVLRFGSKNQRT